MHIAEISALKMAIMESLERRKRLKACRLSEIPEGVEAFHYKDAPYDREKFVQMEVNRLQNVKYSIIKRTLAHAEKVLERNDESAELIAAHISAYLRVLAEKKNLYSILMTGHIKSGRRAVVCLGNLR